MENYSSNSNRSKEENKLEEARVHAVVSNPVSVRSKTKTQKFADNFIKEDLSNVISYALTDIVVPTIKRMIYDAFTNSLDIMLNGKDRRPTTGTTYTTYNRSYSRAPYQPSQLRTVRASSGLEFDNILFADRGDAERVLCELEDLVASEYRIASVQDYYSAAGLSCPYTYNNWGWDDLRAADVIRARDADGYYIKLPKPQQINK